MHARSALFDLYGDHLTSCGNWTPIAGIVRLLGPVDVAAPAVPPGWPGHEAAVLLNTTAASLLPLAREFVDGCLSADAPNKELTT